MLLGSGYSGARGRDRAGRWTSVFTVCFGIGFLYSLAVRLLPLCSANSTACQAEVALGSRASRRQQHSALKRSQVSSYIRFAARKPQGSTVEAVSVV